MSNTAVETGSFFANLTVKKWLSISLAIILALGGIIIYDQREELNKKDAAINALTARYNNIIDNLSKEIDTCNKKRVEDANTNNSYWRDRVEQLEERAYQGYKKVKTK